VGEGTPPGWLLEFSLARWPPTGEGEWGAEEWLDFSRAPMGPEGGDTDPRDPEAAEADMRGVPVNEPLLMSDKGSLAGRDPMGGGGAVTFDVEALITAAAALGAEKLLSGTRGV